MKPKVLINQQLPAEVLDYIGEHCEHNVWNSEVPMTRAQVLEQISEVQGLFVSGEKIDEELLAHAPKLKVVSTASVGYNNFELADMKRHGIIGTHTPYVLDDTVADLIIGLMLASARRIPELDRYMRAGKWEKGAGRSLFGTDVHHKTLGIIGMGRIGEAVAKRAVHGFDMQVLYANRRPNPSAEARVGAQFCSMDELLHQADFVLLMVPLTDSTYRLIGEKQFAMMKPSAIFINASRGQTVDEQALVRSLKTGTIQAAGLDVFEQEPIDPQNPLLQLDNAVLVPHIGSATAATRLEMAMLAAKNLVLGVQDQIPPNVVPELQ